MSRKENKERKLTVRIYDSSLDDRMWELDDR